MPGLAMTECAVEEVCVLDSVVGTASSTPLYTTGVLAGGFRRYMLIATFVAPNDAEDQTVSIGKASDTAATGWAAVETAITVGQTYTLVAHATNNDGKIVIVELNEDALATETAKLYITGRCLSSAAGGGTVGLTLLGIGKKAGPTWSQNALNTTAPYQNRDDDDTNVVMIKRPSA